MQLVGREAAVVRCLQYSLWWESPPCDMGSGCIGAGSAFTAMNFTYEYVHVLLNHLPIHGLAVALLALAAGMVVRSRPAQLIALALTVFCCAMVLVVNYTGDRGFDAVIALTDDAGTEWLDEHTRRAEKVAPWYYAAAAAGVLAIFAPLRWPRASVVLAALTLALGALALLGGGWTAKAGGQIRHPEFRQGGPGAEQAAGRD